jgi:hypothetical protein
MLLLRVAACKGPSTESGSNWVVAAESRENSDDKNNCKSVAWSDHSKAPVCKMQCNHEIKDVLCTKETINGKVEFVFKWPADACGKRVDTERTPTKVATAMHNQH